MYWNCLKMPALWVIIIDPSMITSIKISAKGTLCFIHEFILDYYFAWSTLYIVNWKLTPNSNMNCKSEHVIYLATCPGCEEYYIGETKLLIAQVRVHKQQIKKNNRSEIFHARNTLKNVKEEELAYSLFIKCGIQTRYLERPKSIFSFISTNPR